MEMSGQLLPSATFTWEIPLQPVGRKLTGALEFVWGW